jgi:uncharacterized protein (DUF1800 family)
MKDTLEPTDDCRAIAGQSERRDCIGDQVRDLRQGWIERLAFGPNRREAALIQLWLGIFPVSLRQLGPERAVLLQGQVEAIRAHLNGSYRDLLAAMVADPALQIYLNGPINHRSKPNENLARELLELFSLGEGHFSEQDVLEAARALTGYQLDEHRTLVLDPRRHDPGPMTILGLTATFNGPKLVDWLCEQPATALNITRRLWLQIVGPLPSGAPLEAIAASWRGQSLSLPWLIDTRNAHRK